MTKNGEQQLHTSCTLQEVLGKDGPGPRGAGCMQVAFVHVLPSCFAPLNSSLSHG